MKDIRYRRSLKLATVLWIGIACRVVPTRLTEVPEWLRREWRIGQQRVSSRVPGAHAVAPESFRFEALPNAFDCGGILANGCFSPGSKTIRYNRKTPAVIRHEAGHAIGQKRRLETRQIRCIEWNRS